MIEQSCLTCKHKKECPKAKHFENYTIPGCSDYEKEEKEDETLGR